MAKKAISTKGLTEALVELSYLQDITGLSKAAIYEGAAVVIDAMEKEINSLKVTNYYGTEQKKRYCRPSDKTDLLSGLGIAKMITEEKIHTKVGFAGYYYYKSDETDSADEIRPIPLLANSINAGTSFMHAQPFIDNVVRACSKHVLQVMEKKITEGINRINKK